MVIALLLVLWTVRKVRNRVDSHDIVNRCTGTTVGRRGNGVGDRFNGKSGIDQCLADRISRSVKMTGDTGG